jgi:Mrp family chromosome partitioning ATPase
LAAVLAGTAELDQAVQPSGVPGLSLLPCGPRPANPAELLTAPRFAELLQSVREGYDLVLVDTPALLAVTDPSVVAPRVDGVLLNVRAGGNGRPLSERARDLLADLDAPVVGVVVNGMDRPGRREYEIFGKSYSLKCCNGADVDETAA